MIVPKGYTNKISLLQPLLYPKGSKQTSHYFKDKTIFINIPSYDDSEIWPTIDSFFERAKYKERVFVGVVHQTFDFKTDYQKMHEYKKKYKNQISLRLLLPGTIVGCQPARKYVHNFYNKEDYYLNTDSHCRAMQNWDEDLILEFEELEIEKRNKCVITAYAPSYRIKNGKDDYDDVSLEHNIGFMMNEDQIKMFEERGVIQMASVYKESNGFYPSPYISGHFFFCRGSYVEEVPFVNKIAFSEEEIFMQLRFFSKGIDVYTPRRCFIYHRFDRADNNVERRLIWDDFPEQFFEAHENSRAHCVFITENNYIDSENGLFGVRSIEEYEKIFGVDFKNRTVSENFKNGIYNSY